jgi:phospholipid/cholesterol/gamma-HCH transport system permease protein
MAEARRIEVSQVDGTTSRIHLSGTWRLEDGLPTEEEVDRDVQIAAATPRITFDAQELGGWDSSLVTFLVGLIRACRTRGIEVDSRGLPQDIQRLLSLDAAGPEAPARPAEHPPWLARVGNAATAAGHSTIRILAFVGEATRAFKLLLLGRAQHRRSDLYHEIRAAGVYALPIVTLISVLLGMIMGFVGGVTLRNFGATTYVADLVAIAMVRELSAIMTAIIMAGRTGSAYAAELGTMRVSQEMDALVTMGIPPIEFIVLNRLLALSLMMPLLYLYANLFGIVGGGIVAVNVLGITLSQYAHSIKESLTLTTFVIGIVKSAVFGVLVAICGCLAGLRAGRSAAAVGEAATRAVVSSIVWIVVTDGVFAVVCYLLGI